MALADSDHDRSPPHSVDGLLKDVAYQLSTLEDVRKFFQDTRHTKVSPGVVLVKKLHNLNGTRQLKRAVT
ncbi:unnamed protein product [Cuscuta campestris]|uniref:Uncharacterized protein n=1 Tax=Cuscuta campestris TaxID=132261 RepID=A0A484MMG7_9ASTE|nr:unnamed protein product [Cuscuta campestris]